jgi:hypothetical protein
MSLAFGQAYVRLSNKSMLKKELAKAAKQHELLTFHADIWCSLASLASSP